MVGTVVNVFKSGASDLLQVMLDSSGNLANGNGRTESVVSDSARLVWVPFVEAIVPIVNTIKREMFITPPKGLLQLNLRADERSKKERRQLVRAYLNYVKYLVLIKLYGCNHFLVLVKKRKTKKN